MNCNFFTEAEGYCLVIASVESDPSNASATVHYVLDDFGPGSSPRTRVEILLAADRTAPDVVILEMGDDRLPGVASHLLSQRPTAKMLGLTADGRNGLLYELRSRLTPIHDVSPAQLLGLIRAVVSSEVA